MKHPKNIIIIFSILLVASMILSGCQVFGIELDIVKGSGKMITEKRQLGDFTQVENTTSAKVIIYQGQPLAVVIEGEDNLISYYLTEVSGERLTIKTRPNTSIQTTKPMIVHITVPELTSLRVTGSGDAEMDGWVGEGVNLEATGSGNITIASLVASEITARLSGSGDIRVDGKAEILVVKSSGSGSFEGDNFQVNTLDATLSGSGDVRVWVVQTLEGSLSGSGDLEYYGSPDVMDRSSGSGKVKRLGDAP